MYIQIIIVPLQRNRGYRRNAGVRRRNVGRPAQQRRNAGTGDKTRRFWKCPTAVSKFTYCTTLNHFCNYD